MPDVRDEELATHWNPNGTMLESQDRRLAHRTSNLPGNSSSTNIESYAGSTRAVSPEQKRRTYSPVSAVRARGALSPVSSYRNGARSPVSTLRQEMVQADSPLRSEFNPTTAASSGSAQSPQDVDIVPHTPSPGHSMSPLAREHNAFAQQQQVQQAQVEQQKALEALSGTTPAPAASTPVTLADPPAKAGANPSLRNRDQKHRLSLKTHRATLPPQPPPVPEDEELEIITMSPVARTPVMSFRKSRSSLALSQYGTIGGSSSTVNLSGLNLTSERAGMGAGVPYFGQSVQSSDLVATGIENAFSRL